jgi:membrane protease YdiL (CAAX protease family)
MARKTIFWIVFTITSILSLLYFVNNYNKAFPSLSLDVKMNREMALDVAKKLSQKYNWKPEDGNSAVTFYSERETQTFIEREAGSDFKEGLEIFKNLFQDSLYFPYGWKVRYFEEKKTNEVIVKFTPAGTPYGFYQKLGEDEMGDSLSRDSAFVIATKDLKRDWEIDLSKFELIDESQKIQPVGRVDHSFVYERVGFKLGEEGALRLKLSVSGDKLTEVNHYVHIPEAFKRRFGEIRSLNDTIAFSANMFIFLLYGLAGCVYGIFILLRQKRVLWKGAIKWGLAIAFIQSLMQLNFLPMLWMEYDTASTENSFMLQIILGAFANALIMGFIYTLSFIAAEGLSRKAFPNHVQFWKLFSSRTSNSLTVLGQSMGGYLGTGLFMFYALAFYTFTKSLGWWSPTDTEYDPNILAAYFPWLTSIAISLGAGFWEECLFRAVPLAGAALIGEYYGKRKLFIGIGMVVQAIIFGAAHANYPVQPAYARVVELMIPSFAFGFIYLRYGLLPGIIMHYAYDVAMISLQIFSADLPGIWLQRLIIIFFLFAPLWVILFFRIKFGRWVHKLGSIYNRDWEEPYETHNKNEELVFENYNVLVEPKLFKKNILKVCAIIGFVSWIFFSQFSSNLPALKISKQEAIILAEKAFNEKNITFDNKWVTESQVQAWTGNQGKFIWQTQGSVRYDSLVGNYLPEPGWRIRYRLRDGTTEERAEEYSGWVTNSGKVGITHSLPESSPAVSLEENKARDLAQSAISKTYNINLENLTELEAKSEKKPNRMDWFFRYRDNRNQVNVGNGELRINIKIAGSEITNIWKEVFIPEDWLRSEEEKQSKNMPFNLIEALVIALTILLAVVFGIIRWSKKQFSIPIFVKSLILLMVLRITSLLNNFSNTVWNFSTSKPYLSQLYQSIFSDLVMSVLFMSFIGALIVGLTHKLIKENTNNNSSLLNGIYLGIFASGILSFVYSLYPQIEPSIGRFWDLNYEIPFLGGMLSFLGNYIQMTLFYLTICIGLVTLTKNWSKLLPAGITYIVALGFVASVSGSATFESIPIWIISSLALSIVIYAIHRDLIQYNIHLIPVVSGTIVVLNIARNGIINIHSGAYLIALLSILSVVILAYIWSNQLTKSVEK